MRTAYLSLGSNLGNKDENILKAFYLIGNRYEILNYSSLYLTAPVGFREQPFFLNMVIKIDSEKVTPIELLDSLKSLEKEIGRKESFRWGPRLIDIDILYIEGIKIDTEVLTVPHRELFKRNFVLIPLSEITEYITVDEKRLRVKDFINPEPDSINSVTLYKHVNFKSL